ncbi:MAG: nicotinate-nucleotide adenylyltransferase [Firmicutes bacterium]|nr:nicotinate-nucleotide adenylyltransferase [Bacillota bacterium]
MRRIGIMGGTFDPVHLGHTGIAEAAARELALDEVRIMPAFVQPFKQDREVSPAQYRLAMLKLAAMESRANLTVDTWEIERGCVSYTYDTLYHLTKAEPDVQFYFILGSDSLLTIETWYRAKQLLRLTGFAVGSRPTNDLVQVEQKAEAIRRQYGAEIILIRELMLPVSSTMIRDLVRSGQPISGLVSPLVENYIYEQRLYSEGSL